MSGAHYHNKPKRRQEIKNNHGTDLILRVLTINTHKGFSTLNRRFILYELREAIRSTSADIVFLQEVTGKNSTKSKRHFNWPSDPHYKFLAEATWTDYSYGKNAEYPDGHHGNAILSIYPIIYSEKVDISTNRIEQRGCLYCQLEIKNCSHPLHCICVHLGLFGKSRKKQLKMLESYIDKKIHDNGPLIIAGDFNEWGKKKTSEFAEALGLKEVFQETYGKRARTFPAWMPILPLDRIYYRGLTIIDSKVYYNGIWSQISDHAALFSKIALN